MSEFDLEQAWEPYLKVLPLRDAANAIANAAEFAGERLLAVIPNIQLRPDGPRVHTIFLVTSHLLAEATLDGTSFDYVDRVRVLDIKWYIGQVAFQGADGPIVYETRSVQLAHGTPGHVSSLSYVGTDPKPWLDVVCNWFPAILVTSR